MDFAKYPVLHPQVATRIVDGEALIVLADSGQVNVLNPVGTRMWELMDGTRTIQQIADAICDEFDVGKDEAERDLEEFVQQLIGANAIVLQDQPSPRS
jgi:Coenzyme PQQ synthesis protein D (PqqD)